MLSFSSLTYHDLVRESVQFFGDAPLLVRALVEINTAGQKGSYSIRITSNC